MDSNNWQPSQVDPPPREVAGADWRTTLQADSRSRIVNILQISQHSGHMAQEQNPNGSTLLQGGSQEQQMMLQRLQLSDELLQQQNVIDPEMMLQSQQTPPEAAPSNSTAQTGSTEAQEEVYQKLKAMKDLYLTEVLDVYQKICLKLQQHDSLPQQPMSEAVEKLKYFKQIFERILKYLQLSRMDALQVTKDRVAQLERQIISIVSSHRPRNPDPPLQQNQQSHSQIPQTQSHENGAQLQNVSSLSGITTSQQNMMNSLQPGSNLESAQGNAPNSIQQVVVGSIQQIPASVPPHHSQAEAEHGS